MKKRMILIITAALCAGLCGCAGQDTNEAVQPESEMTAEVTSEPEQEAVQPSLSDCALTHNPDTAGVLLDISIDDFNALGFAYGDSVDLKFSNGYELDDIPYYNGYYTAAYDPLLVAYPGSESVKAKFNYGDDLWEVAELSEGDTADVFLNEAGKYLNIQEAGDIQYTDDREDYPSDEVFANFRNVTAGGIKENVLYRSASPCDNKHNRAAYADGLIEAAGVQYIMNLADSDEDIEGYIDAEDFDSPYYLGLYQTDNVDPLYMSMNFVSDDFQDSLADGLTEMADEEGPYLVHCLEGKDRTGFVCILLEALCGASYEEIEADYMLTYDNYYGITEDSDPTRYNTIRDQNLNVILEEIVSDDSADITTADLSEYAEQYMLRIGVSEEIVKELKQILM